MILNKSNKDIIEEIKKEGFCILENCYTTKDLDEMKSSLLHSLNYIKPDEETDLQKKYYKVRDFDLLEFIKIELSKSVRLFCSIIFFRIFTYSEPVCA